MGYTSEYANNELSKAATPEKKMRLKKRVSNAKTEGNRVGKTAAKTAKKISKLSDEYDKRAELGNVPTGKGMKKKMVASAMKK